MKVINYFISNSILIELQYKSLKKYLKNNFEYIIFNHSKDDEEAINKICKNLNIKYINIPNYELSNNLKKKSLGMNFIIKYQIANPDQYLIIEDDVFLIDYLDINNRYKDFKIAFNFKTKIDEKIIRYIWSGIIYIDLTKIDDIYYLDWFMSEIWLNRQIKDDEKIPSINEIYFNRIDDYNTSNIYFIKCMKNYSWSINEIPENLNRKINFKQFLLEDKRNYGELIYSEIYDNIFYHYKKNKEENNNYLINNFDKIIIDVDDN